MLPIHYLNRPIPHNVSKSVIKDTDHFNCIVEKNVSIDSFNRTMMLLPDIYVCDEKSIEVNTLDNLIDELLRLGIIHHTPTNTHSLETDVLILVNGGLLTKYSTTTPFEVMFHAVKKVNPMIEVVHGDGFFMFNQTPGIPFKPIPNGTMVSPIELKRYFKDFKNTSDSIIFGENCSQELIDLAQYANFTKVMVGVNFHKNRLGGSVGKKFFKFTSENICPYISEKSKNFNDKTDSIEMVTIFSSHPQLTADGYILSTSAQFDTDLVQRSRFEMEILPDTNIEFLNVTSKDCMPEYDMLGNVVRKHLCVATFQRIGSALPIRVFPQTKFYLNTVKTSNGFTYNLFRQFDERATLENDFEIQMFAFRVKDKKKFRLSFDLIIDATQSFMDGTKFSDFSSQKGVSTLQDTSRFAEKLGFEPQVIAPICSIVGRGPLMQLKSLKMKQVRHKKCPKVLAGLHEFAALRNVSSAMKSIAKARFEVYGKKILASNNLPICIYELQQATYDEWERHTFLPAERRNNLSIINTMKTAIMFSDSYGNSHIEFQANEFQ